jgi:hypothetical protein
MDDLYRWVDDAAPRDASFCARRTSRLLVTLLISSALSALPIGLLWLGIDEWQRAKAERLEREKLQQQERELIQAVEEGRTGEAFRRLFEVKPKE